MKKAQFNPITNKFDKYTADKANNASKLAHLEARKIREINDGGLRSERMLAIKNQHALPLREQLRLEYHSAGDVKSSTKKNLALVLVSDGTAEQDIPVRSA
ncbi:hypothetical protein J5893_04505 [bacterium]|nr:hypothetical protein [bacterium]